MKVLNTILTKFTWSSGQRQNFNLCNNIVHYMKTDSRFSGQRRKYKLHGNITTIIISDAFVLWPKVKVK